MLVLHFVCLRNSLSIFTIFHFILLTHSLSSVCESDRSDADFPRPIVCPLNPDIATNAPPKPGWIDPFDMTGDSTNTYSSFSHESLFVQSDVEIHMQKNRIVNYDTFLKRFVNLFLRSVNLKESTDLEYDASRQIKLEFYIPRKDVEVLQQFAQCKHTEGSLQEISEVFDKIFSQPQFRYDGQPNSFNLRQWVTNRLSIVLKSPEWTIFSSVALMLVALVWFLHKTHSYRLAIFSLLLIIFIAGFGFNWMRMYEEEEVKKYYDSVKYNGKVPYHCSGQSMAWYEHMYYRMFGEDCYQFFKRRDVRPIVKISPTEVLAETFSSMIVRPIESIGKAYGKFIASSISHTPWLLKPIVVPFVIIVPLLFVVMLLAFLFNYQLSLSWFSISLLPSWTRSVEHKKNDKYVEDLSNKQNNTSVHNMLGDEKKPLFLMNWPAYKKVASKVNLMDKDDNSTDNEDTSPAVNSEEGTTNVVEGSGASPEKRKKKRSIHTLGEKSVSRVKTEQVCNASGSGDHANGLDSGDKECLAIKPT